MNPLRDRLPIIDCVLNPFLLLELIQSLSSGLFVPYNKGTYTYFRQRPMSDIAY